MIVESGSYQEFTWTLKQSDTIGYWNRVLTIMRHGRIVHSIHVDRAKWLGNPRFARDEIDRIGPYLDHWEEMGWLAT